MKTTRQEPQVPGEDVVFAHSWTSLSIKDIREAVIATSSQNLHRTPSSCMRRKVKMIHYSTTYRTENSLQMLKREGWVPTNNMQEVVPASLTISNITRAITSPTLLPILLLATSTRRTLAHRERPVMTLLLQTQVNLEAVTINSPRNTSSSRWLRCVIKWEISSWTLKMLNFVRAIPSSRTQNSTSNHSRISSILQFNTQSLKCSQCYTPSSRYTKPWNKGVEGTQRLPISSRCTNHFNSSQCSNLDHSIS